MSSANAKRNKNLPVLIVAALILIVLVVGIIYELIHQNTPSTERADLGTLYPVEEGTAAVISNGVLSESRAVWNAQRAYLALSIVQNELNSRFYWDTAEQLLVVTTANEVIIAGADTQFEGGPVFLKQEETVYVSLDYVAQYTNIQVDTYTNPNRVFLRTQWGETTTGDVEETGQVRTEADVKSPVITEVTSGARFTILEQQEDWSTVYTQDGFVGYMQNNQMTGVETVEDSGPYQAPEYTRTTLDEKVFLVWHQVFEESGVSSLNSLLENAQGLNVLAPTWFSIQDEEGNLESRASHEYVEIAHSRGIQVWALVENINIEGVDPEELLNVTSHRTNLINGLMAQAEEYDLDGINVDLEELPAGAGEGYIQFIRELSVACRQRGLVLSVDNYVPSAWTEHYYRAEQGVVADYVVVMAYDEHYSGSDAGSTSSLEFVRQGVEDTLAEVPAEKLICALPFYTRLWTETGGFLTSETVAMNDVDRVLAAHPEATETWLPEQAQTYVYEETEGGVTYQMWVEDETSLQEKLDILSSYGLAGIGGWKLGMETDGVWALISSFLSAS